MAPIDYVLIGISACVAAAILFLIEKMLEEIMSNLDELNAKLDAIAEVVTQVGADVADLLALLAAADSIPQEILDKADAIKASLDSINAQH